MNEIIPPSEPGKEPPPSKKVCAALGFALFVVTAAFSFTFPPFFLVGWVVAVASLFFQGYRCVFVGYILTVGVLLLAAIIYCAGHPLHL